MRDATDDPAAPGFRVLVCDEAEPPFGAAHGLSLLIRPAGGEPLVFDTGPDAELLRANMELAGMDGCPAGTVVLSHGHYDHTGGLGAFAGCSPAPTVYAGRGFDATRYHVSGHGTRSIGLPPCVDLEPFEVRTVRGAFDLPGGVRLVSPVAAKTFFERGERGLTLDAKGRKPDTFEDETIVVMEIGGGVAVFTGCAHRGVVNSALAGSRAFGGAPVKAVIGGFHLRDAGMERIEATADALEEMGVERIIAGHCTGAAAMKYLAERFGERFLPLAAGREYRL